MLPMNMKKGLVLEGGAMRGMFTAGVLDVLLENNINFDGMIGVSAGATFGCNFKSKQMGRTIRYNTRFAGDKRYCSLRSWLKTGDLYNADFCYNQIPNVLDMFDNEAFRKNPMKFYVVASDCNTGLPIYKELESCDADEMEWMRASASMPVVSRPVEVDGYTLLDGGITDSIPVMKFEEMGYGQNVVVLTQPRNYVKKPFGHEKIVQFLLKKVPKVYEALQERHNIYNQERKYVFDKADRGELVVICPKTPLDIKRTEKDTSKLKQVYEQGRIVALGQLAEIKNFLEIK